MFGGREVPETEAALRLQYQKVPGHRVIHSFILHALLCRQENPTEIQPVLSRWDTDAELEAGQTP